MQTVKYLFAGIAVVIDTTANLVIIAVVLRIISDALWVGTPFNTRLRALTDPIYTATEKITKHKIKERFLVPVIIILSLMFLRTVIAGFLQDMAH